MAEDRVCIGLITRPVGVVGCIKVQPYVLSPALLLEFRSVSLDDGTLLNISSARVDTGGGVVLRLDGYGDRNSVEPLRMQRLFVSKSAFPKLEADEYYLFELQDLEILGNDGNSIGHVIIAQDFGAGAFLEVRLSAGNILATIPFHRESVLEVDLSTKQIRIDEAFLIY
ncbi:MAG: ribosome maturation factor RimM [Holosporales bacterium]|jgi:16S rRNA processing protein RimM|nr:ribosome maturation factor RimM [Holosporales bacterium]